MSSASHHQTSSNITLDTYRPVQFTVIIITGLIAGSRPDGRTGGESMERSTSPAGPAPTRPVDAADAVGLTVLLLAGPGLLACAAALLQTGTSAPGAELTRVLGLGAGLAGLGLLACCLLYTSPSPRD